MSKIKNSVPAENVEPAPEGKKRGRKPSQTPTIAAVKAAIVAHRTGGDELPEWLTLRPGQFVEGSTRWNPGEYRSHPFFQVSEDGRTATVTTVTANEAGKNVQIVSGESVSVDKYL